MKKKNILVIYTGGTIGMTPSDEGYVPVSGFENLLKEYITHKSSFQLPSFDVLEYENLIDSANIQLNHWKAVGETLQNNWSKYDGFIVLHGTDTMAYTASALSFMFQGIDKPIILTGSQIPLAQLRNDALENLVTSLIIAGNDKGLKEVAIYFNGRLLRGNRSSKVSSTEFDAFDSPNYPYLGEIGINIKINTNHFLENQIEKITIPEFINQHVFILNIFPSMDKHMLDAIINLPGLKGLILQSYGVGNIPNENIHLMNALKKASDNGVIILNTTQCIEGKVNQQSYQTGVALNNIVVISGSDITLESAFAKMHYLLSTESDAQIIKKKLTMSISGELS